MEKGNARARLAEKYGLDAPFIFYLSRLEHPAKNHVRLIEAFERFKAGTDSPHKLVLPGADWNGAGAIKERAAASPVRDDIVFPGFVDLQVNGGGGVMFNDAPSVDTLRIIAEAHASLGTSAFLPTLITDTPEATKAAITAVEAAIKERVSGIAGLHLEGPHLSVARKGAHDPALIRPMQETDLAMLLDAPHYL